LQKRIVRVERGLDKFDITSSKRSLRTLEATMPAADLSPWLTVKEAAIVAKCGTRTIRKEVAAGRLRAARIGGRRDIRIHRDWVDAWLEATATPVEVRPLREVVRR
jgi:excisionase family DNA binding protein